VTTTDTAREQPERKPASRQTIAPALQVTRLLQNPLGQVAPKGAEGDIVRVSDDTKTIYLTPREYAQATDVDLRWSLAAAPCKRRP
jgi:hypothetical protein